MSVSEWMARSSASNSVSSANATYSSLPQEAGAGRASVDAFLPRSGCRAPSPEPVKAALLATAVVVTLAVAGCGGSADRDDAARARAYAAMIACAGEEKACEPIEAPREVADGVWRFRYADDTLCVSILLDDFAVRGGDRFDGAAPSLCS